ncbi:LuxR C-terminal-related transcriptional regulator [Gryllotalpicola koreensis]|uniref:LuxR family transcriptional regulator n=1 Tax=Gryllotalpicola koreensis TaxID=993086 RepID=A0ABP8A978_9MICO
MSAYPTPRAVATAATYERLRSAIARVAALTLEPRARVGSVLVYGPPGHQPATLLRDCVRFLEDWTLVAGVADERERMSDWAFLESLGSTLAHFGAQLTTPLSAPGVPDDPTVVGRGLARALAGIEAPICLIVENMHFVDEKSADAVRFAMRRHGRQPQLLLMSTESLASPNELTLLSLAQQRPENNVIVRVPALSAADVQELAVERAGRPLAGRVARHFVEDTEGNPTLIAGLFEAYSGDLRRALHPAAVDLDRGRIVPLLPHQQRALGEAPLGVRTAAEIVAVLREPTAIAAVNRVAAWLGITDSFGAFDLDGAERAGLVRFIADAAVPTVAPPTRVAGDAIAAGITIDRRREIHRAAADVLTGVTVLRHRIGAMDVEDVTLVADLIEGALTRAAVGDAERAMSLALSAVQLAAPGAEYERALLSAGTLALRLHEHQRVFGLKGEVAALPESQLRDAILADLEVLTGNRDAGIERALAVIAAPDDSPTGRALRAHAAAMIPLYDAVNEHHELVGSHVAAARRILASAPVRAADVAPELRWLVRPGENELWLTSWELVAAARLREPERLADRMARLDLLLRSTPDSPAAVDAIVYRARTLLYAGRVTDAANLLHRAIRVAGGYPNAWMRHTALTMYAHVLFLTGDWQQALITGRKALDSAFDDPYRATLPTAYAISGLVPAARGDAAEVQRVERLIGLLPPTGGGAVPYDPDLADLMRAELGAALGDPLAQLRATEAARVATRRGSAWSWLPLHVDALLALGRTAEALSIANEALSGQTPWSRSPHAASRLRARIALATRELEQAKALYAGVVKSQTGASQPFLLARDRVDYASVLQASGDADGALEQLELAAATFRRLKAGTYLMRTLERIEALADERPAVPPPPVRPALDQPANAAVLAELTAREREVALAVASGLTNREVAEQLYISVTTVNFHVRNILAKLGLRSRRELRVVLHRKPRDGDGTVRS